jgi:hypothetical protein
MVALGAGLIVAMLLSSSGYSPLRGLLGSVGTMEIILSPGHFVGDPNDFIHPPRLEGRVSVGARLPLAAASLLMLVGLTLVALDSSRRGTAKVE